MLYDAAFSVGHHYRNAVLITIVNGAIEMLCLTVGRELLEYNRLIGTGKYKRNYLNYSHPTAIVLDIDQNIR